MPNINLAILNQKATPAFFADTLANRPAPSFVGRIFISTDTLDLYRDTGTAWLLLSPSSTGTITGSGAAGQVTYFSAASSITGSNDLFWDSVNGHLGIGTNVPATALNIFHDQNQIIQLNQTTATNDTKIAFQNNGVGLWRIGNSYNAGANDFAIYDNIGAIQQFTIKKTTGQTLIGGGSGGSGKLVVESGLGDNGIQIVSAVAPSLRIDNANTGPTKRIGIAIATAVNNFIQGAVDRDMCIFNGSTTASPILFGVYDAAAVNVQEAARVTASRNLLVGTSVDAGNKLEVNGNINVQSNQFFRYNGDFGLIGSATAITGGVNTQLGIRAANDILFATNGANERMRITTAGFIGINTTTPFDRFSVGGNILVDAGNNEGFKLNGGLFIYRLSGNDLGIFTNSAERARFTNGGNLLIGTTTDAGQKLQVNGVTQSNSYKSISGTVSIASGATATAYTIPSVTNFDGLYLVQVEVTSGSAIYMASGIITALAGNGQMFLTNLYTGANVVLSVSGMNIQITNAGFGTFTWNYTLLFQSI
jgi:hypothetical protein